jgi:hypothetical protein
LTARPEKGSMWCSPSTHGFDPNGYFACNTCIARKPRHCGTVLPALGEASATRRQALLRARFLGNLI